MSEAKPANDSLDRRKPMGEPRCHPRPVAAGDLIPHWYGKRRVLDVKPYTGRYPEHFNVVLILEADTRSGKIERAFDDPALRRAR